MLDPFHPFSCVYIGLYTLKVHRTPYEQLDSRVSAGPTDDQRAGSVCASGWLVLLRDERAREVDGGLVADAAYDVSERVPVTGQSHQANGHAGAFQRVT